MFVLSDPVSVQCSLGFDQITLLVIILQQQSHSFSGFPLASQAGTLADEVLRRRHYEERCP